MTDLSTLADVFFQADSSLPKPWLADWNDRFFSSFGARQLHHLATGYPLDSQFKLLAKSSGEILAMHPQFNGFPLERHKARFVPFAACAWTTRSF